MLAGLLRLHDGLTRLTFRGAAVAVAYVTLVTALEVFQRYALRMPSDWAPDTSAIAFAFVTFLAAPELTARGGHAAMTFFLEGARPAISRWMLRLTCAIGALACGLCAWFGGLEAARQIEGGVTMIAVTPIPKWVVTVVIVYGLASMALHFLRQLAGSFRTGSADAEGITPDGEKEWSGTFS